MNRDCWRQGVDRDLGFPRATNSLSVRRLGLQVGEVAEVPPVLLDVTSGQLEVLAQRAERRSATEYWYEVPRFGYAALLEVSAVGFPLQYPGLWMAED